MDIQRKRDPEEAWLFDPEIAAVDRRIRTEFREESAAVEADVHEADLREQTFSDIASDMYNRGDFVAVATSRRTFNGLVVYAAGDLITIQTESFEVDVNLGDVAYIKVIHKGVQPGGAPAQQGPGTFEMRLMERRSSVERVELGYRNLEETVIGNLMTVGQDHVILRDDHKQEWVIAIHTISWVIRRGRRVR